MNRALLLVALLPAVARAATIDAGTFELRGDTSLGLSTASVSSAGRSSDVTQLSLGGRGLYYVLPDVGLGLDASYSAIYEGSLRSSSLFAGPALALSHPLDPRVSLFALVDVGYVRDREQELGGVRETPGLAFDVGAGVKYFLARQLSIDVGVAYLRERLWTDGGPTTFSRLGLNAGISVYLGK